jgi:hypothetical protein
MQKLLEFALREGVEYETGTNKIIDYLLKNRKECRKPALNVEKVYECILEKMYLTT